MDVYATLVATGLLCLALSFALNKLPAKGACMILACIAFAVAALDATNWIF